MAYEPLKKSSPPSKRRTRVLLAIIFLLSLPILLSLFASVDYRASLEPNLRPVNPPDRLEPLPVIFTKDCTAQNAEVAVDAGGENIRTSPTIEVETLQPFLVSLIVDDITDPNTLSEAARCLVDVKLEAPGILDEPIANNGDLLSGPAEWTLSADNPGVYDLMMTIMADCTQPCQAGGISGMILHATVIANENEGMRDAQKELMTALSEATIVPTSYKPLQPEQQSPLSFSLKFNQPLSISNVVITLTGEHETQQHLLTDQDAGPFTIVYQPTSPHNAFLTVPVVARGTYEGSQLVAVRDVLFEVDVQEESLWKRLIVNNLGWIATLMAIIAGIGAWIPKIRTLLVKTWRRIFTREPREEDQPNPYL